MHYRIGSRHTTRHKRRWKSGASDQGSKGGTSGKSGQGRTLQRPPCCYYDAAAIMSAPMTRTTNAITSLATKYKGHGHATLLLVGFPAAARTATSTMKAMLAVASFEMLNIVIPS